MESHHIDRISPWLSQSIAAIRAMGDAIADFINT
jgi:hypothetical protein